MQTVHRLKKSLWTEYNLNSLELYIIPYHISYSPDVEHSHSAFKNLTE